jgi:hypothetical protein
MNDIRTRIACIALVAGTQGGCGDAPVADVDGTATDTGTATGTATDTGADESSDEETESPPDEPVSSTFVRFDLGPAPLALGAVPFPSELYRGEDGRIALGALPNPRSDDPVFDATRELLAARDGFCSTCNTVFVIEGGLGVDSLAADDASPSLEDAIVIVDVDPGSPEHGRLFGVRWQWDDEAGWLTVRPRRGETLAGGRRYAIAITDAARGTDDLPIGAAPEFLAVRDEAAGDDPELQVAAETLAPSLAELEALGLPRARVRGLAAFRTEDPTADLRAIREAIASGPAPILSVDATWSGAELDVLLGIPGENRPGIDVPPAPGTEGSAAIPHETVEIVVAGRFSAKRFVSGRGVEIGATVRDAEGRPLAGPEEEVPFVLIVPKDVDLGQLPVVVMHHGFNASRTTAFAIADTAGRAGFAVLGIDAFQHGERAASATDQWHAMRGNVAGADGFAETAPFDVSARTFGLLGAPADLTLFAGYPLGAFEQFAADALSAIHLVRAGDPGALQAADPVLAGLAFDPSRIAYVGNSMGAVVGTAVVNVEPDIDAAVLNVLPGSIIETLAESGEFRGLMESVLLPQLGVSNDFDELERAMIFDPTVDLYRWVLQPVDPLALARTLAHERVAGPAPHLLVQIAGHDEVAAPPASESVIAAARIVGVGQFAFADVEPVELPLPAAGADPEAATIAAVRFEDAMHGMLEVASQASHYEDPLVPPLSPREPPIDLVNPIALVHDQLEGFLLSFRTTGQAAIEG